MNERKKSEFRTYISHEEEYNNEIMGPIYQRKSINLKVTLRELKPREKSKSGRKNVFAILILRDN